MVAPLVDHLSARIRTKRKGMCIMATGTGQHLESIAQELFEALTHISLSVQTNPRRGLDLKEMEFLTLSILHNQPSMIVGDIQRLLGILPAQMSRIIRSLENRQPALIACQINPRDKRKIDVNLSSAGEQALLEYQEVRIHKLTEVLEPLCDDDKDELLRVVHKLNEVFERTS